MFIQVSENQSVNMSHIVAIKRDIDTGRVKQCTMIDGRIWIVEKAFADDFESAFLTFKKSEGAPCEKDS